MVLVPSQFGYDFAHDVRNSRNNSARRKQCAVRFADPWGVGENSIGIPFADLPLASIGGNYV
jgi:hypothetical protein